ncbi:MAG: class I SAM-dependent methyltransferase [Sedimenticola sp.]|nr:class I SAM-dependent methyltransferase [Sedimenticola sp.]
MPAEQTNIFVGAETVAHEAAARALALELKFPLAGDPLPQSGLLLQCGEAGLALCQLGNDAPGPVRVDFVSGRAAHRRLFGGGRGQPLARAVGMKQGRTPSVLDMTAGLGRDAFVLASLGCEVEMIERSPLIHALLRDGLRRALLEPETVPIAGRMRLHHLDSLGLLEIGALPRSQVVYLDPMYPHRRKSALVKKEMRLFQQLVGEDGDSAGLLAVARKLAGQRVVVKRPAGAEPLAESVPAYSISSPNTRYDVYLPEHPDADV